MDVYTSSMLHYKPHFPSGGMALTCIAVGKGVEKEGRGEVELVPCFGLARTTLSQWNLTN